MEQYLQICSGRYRLLVAARGVREVLDLAGDRDTAQASHGYRLWRGAGISVIDLRALLAGETVGEPPLVALVYEADATAPPVMLLCDEVVGLIQAEETSFRALPVVEERLGHYFDKVLPEARTGRILLRLRELGSGGEA